MDPTTLSQVAQWSTGNLVAGSKTVSIQNLSTDTRSLQPNDLFIAIRGQNFDGHRLVHEAAQRGAIGAIVEEIPPNLPADFAVILVSNTLEALQSLATHYRQTLPLRALAVTGSSGKTTAKDLTLSVLRETFQVTGTAGNLNNHLGVPLSLLQAQSSDQFGVFEIGMNHPGETAPLAKIVAPEIAIITNIGTAHLEFLHTRDAIAHEKGYLAEALPSTGTLILNAHDDYTPTLTNRTRASVVLAGIDLGEVFASNLTPHFTGTSFLLHAHGQVAEANLPVPGRHMVLNAVLATAAGIAAGLSLTACATGLAKLRLTPGRLQQKIIRGIHLLDDTYNANPESVVAALQTLATLPSEGQRIAVLGRMGELGDQAEASHRLIGQTVAQLPIDRLITVGQDARWIADAAETAGLTQVLRLESTAEATQALLQFAQPEDLVLIKGSRSAKMELILNGLAAQ